MNWNAVNRRGRLKCDGRSRSNRRLRFFERDRDRRESTKLFNISP